MRPWPFLLLLALLPVAHAASYDLEMHDHFYRLAGREEQNPPLFGRPGEEVTFRVVNRGSAPHNLHFGPPLGVETPCCQAPGESATLVVTLPRDFQGPIAYYDVLHPDVMRGVLNVTPTPPSLARVVILQPQAERTMPASFEVVVSVENFTLVPVAEGAVAHGRGHLHYSVDGGPAQGGWDTHETRLRLSGLADGHHLLRVEAVGADHEPLSPRVFAERVVFVSSAAQPPPVTHADPPTPTTTNGAPGFGLLAALIATVGLACRRR